MSDIDLDSMSMADLKKLEKRVASAIASFEDRRKAEAYEKVDELAKSLGFSLRDLTGTATVRKRSRATPKYQNPDQPEVTWSGRGRKPAWFTMALESGKSPEDMEI